MRCGSAAPEEAAAEGRLWGGTGSGAFSAEQFEVSSQSDCTGYVSAMLQASPMGGRRRSLADAEGNTTNTTARRALQSRGSADNMRNRRNAWVQGASSVLNAVADCATSGHRRAQAQGNETQGTLTAAEALQAFHNVTSRRRLSGCDYSSCSSCTHRLRLQYSSSSPRQLVKTHDAAVVLPSDCQRW